MTVKKNNTTILLLAGVLSLIPGLCFAKQAVGGNSTELFNTGYLLQVFGAFLLVLGCLFGLIFLLKKFNAGSMLHGNMPVRILSSTRVGTREKIVLLDAGGQQLLVGVTPGNIRTLHTFAQPIMPTKPGNHADFKTVLRETSGEQSA